MSIAVVSLLEERSNYGYDDTPEKKRLKIGDLPTVDNALKLQTVGKAIQYFCMICDCRTDHNELNCPDSSKGMGMACSICRDPCEIEEHILEWKLVLKFCVRCGACGNHWSKDCPDPDDDCDFDDVDQKCLNLINVWNRPPLHRWCPHVAHAAPEIWNSSQNCCADQRGWEWRVLYVVINWSALTDQRGREWRVLYVVNPVKSKSIKTSGSLYSNFVSFTNIRRRQLVSLLPVQDGTEENDEM
ncbi:hypothetical protein POM88_053747 [Heracleum sosnowskyi]|uniref:Uncharacterized protein n=1 Tax=Heracleum sosnowskyi TaxID=360622 RepID=A0AAD8GQ13_9APIA|nr:hypothetical protein POM88_053747 [Heracleum sosnowskyi]